MNDTNIIAFLKDKKLGEMLKLSFERMNSAERSLKARGMKLFYGVPEKKWGKLSIKITERLEHIDGTYDLYIIDSRVFDIVELERLYFDHHSRILILHEAQEEAQSVYEFFERKVTRLLCLRLPLIEFELECAAKQMID